ncbi:hypothetical protein [Novosphingobium sp. B 225]|uniref:hypothetical protein n=1 Tax=Novosphingobium sp. B 225 TaxID=1961849 RepID=UPI001C3E2D7D|nr:hypothetical protein [Novosphingobium sp. B 225]
MGLFKPDLYRSFGIGFVLGALALTGAMVAQGRAQISGPIPAAQAAPALPDQTR